MCLRRDTSRAGRRHSLTGCVPSVMGPPYVYLRCRDTYASSPLLAPIGPLLDVDLGLIPESTHVQSSRWPCPRPELARGVEAPGAQLIHQIPRLRVFVQGIVIVGSILLAWLSVPGSASAQIWNSQEGRYSSPMRTGLPKSSGGFMFCRLWYNTSRSMRSGLGWSTDYPAADSNFMTRLEELTPTHIKRWKNGDPGIVALRATDPDIFKCPFLFMTDPGSVTFTQAEIDGLRSYLLKGGFLWADDLWGNRAWNYFETEMRRIFPEYTIEEITPEHKLFSVLYAVPEVPQIPSYQSWQRNGGQTSEFGAETAIPHLRGIFDDNRRLLVLVSFNTDIADGWEREGDVPFFFYTFSPKAYGLGINIILWVMSH